MSADPSTAPGARPATWLDSKERGAVFFIALVVRLARLLGRRAGRAFLAPVSLYYAITDRAARQASHDWWRRVEGRPVGFWTVYRHIRTFANVTLDRVFLLTGETHYFEIDKPDHEHLAQLAREGRGAVLLGAHLGSFEAMRAGGSAANFPINIVGHFENARMITALLSELNPELSARVLHVGDGTQFILEVRDCIERGEWVAILGDRVGLHEKSVEVEFFGAPARFAAGPFLLASILRCPVYLVFGLYTEPNRYELLAEPFADPLVLPRHDRMAGVREVAQRYAARLEEVARTAPANWFNFYPFWAES